MVVISLPCDTIQFSCLAVILFLLSLPSLFFSNSAQQLSETQSQVRRFFEPRALAQEVEVVGPIPRTRFHIEAPRCTLILALRPLTSHENSRSIPSRVEHCSIASPSLPYGTDSEAYLLRQPRLGYRSAISPCPIITRTPPCCGAVAQHAIRA